MEVSFELKLLIDKKEKEKQVFEARGNDGDILREALFSALEKCKAKFIDKATEHIARAGGR